jgi:hypothetical protein
MAGAIGGAAASVDGGAEVGLLAGGILGTIAMIFMVVMLIAALPGLLAGWGILSRKSWAPILASIVGLFHVMSIPFGTALAVYTWWTMLSKGGQAAYKT